MIRPFLALDIDGVAAKGVSWRALLAPKRHPYLPAAIAQLNHFCAETKAVVGPISARLRITPAKHFVEGLRSAGFEGDFHPRLAVPRSWVPFSRSRDLEIFMHEEGIPHAALVIADDAPVGYSQAQMARLVRPHKEVGFNADNREQATHLLSTTHLHASLATADSGTAYAVHGKEPFHRAARYQVGAAAVLEADRLEGAHRGLGKSHQSFAPWRERIVSERNEAAARHGRS